MFFDDWDSEKSKRVAFVFIAAGVLFLAAWFLWPAAVQLGTLKVSVFNTVSDEPIDGAAVELIDSGAVIALLETDGGQAVFVKAPLKPLALKVTRKGFEDFTVSADASQKQSFVARLTPIPQISSQKTLEELLRVEPDAQKLGVDAVELSAAGLSYCGDGVVNENEACDLKSECGESEYCSTNCKCMKREVLPGSVVLDFREFLIAKGGKEGLGDYGVLIQDFSESSVMAKFFKGGEEISGLQIVKEGTSWSVPGFQAEFTGFDEGKAAFVFKLIQEPVLQEFSGGIYLPLNGSIEARTVFEVSGAATAPGGVDFVEVSLDGGVSWKKALGTEEWAYRGVLFEGGWRDITVRAKSREGTYSDPLDSVAVFFSSCKRLWGSTNIDKAIDVVVVPSSYSSLAGFKQSVDDAVTQLFAQNVFKENPELKEKINFYYYSVNSECRLAGPNPPEDRMWDCNLPDSLYGACSFADVTAVLVNSSKYGGTGGNPFIQTAGRPRVFVHETGHALFGLADRYCCTGGYWEERPYPNLWSNLNACSSETGFECRKLVRGTSIRDLLGKTAQGI
ncbi:MAG: M64 family metallopeptidase, partial [Candidatus Micrarchaeota archaeon]